MHGGSRTQADLLATEYCRPVLEMPALGSLCIARHCLAYYIVGIPLVAFFQNVVDADWAHYK